MLRFVLIAVMAMFTSLTINLSAQADNLLEPVLVEGTTEYKFRTKLNECAAREGVNFNNHFTVCTIGQGPDFQIIFIIDRNTGHAKLAMSSVDGKDKPVTSSLGVEVSRDSDTMVVNPEFWMSPGDEVPARLSRQFYQYDEDTRKFVFLSENQEQSPRPAK